MGHDERVSVAREATAVGTNEVLLFLSFQGVRGKDLTSKSDPRATVLIGGRTVGQTEVAYNTHDGAWATPTRLLADEQDRVVKVVVVDHDIYKAHNRLGEACFAHRQRDGQPWPDAAGELARACGPPGPASALADRSGAPFRRQRARVDRGARRAGGPRRRTARAAARGDQAGQQGLGRAALLGPVRDDFASGRFRSDVFKSEVLSKTSSPRWAPAEIAMDALCRGDRRKRLKLSVLDWDQS